MGKRKFSISLPEDVIYNKAAGFVSVNKLESETAERALVLTPFQINKFAAKNYLKNGFYISRVNNSDSRSEIDLLQLEMQRKNFSSRNGNLPVFNTFSNEDPRLMDLKQRGIKVDMGRNMIHISNSKSKKLVAMSVSVGNILRRKIAEDLNLNLNKKTNPMVLTVLETEEPKEGDAVPDQLMHCDVDVDEKELDAEDAFIGLLACQDGETEIRVLPRSHLIAKSEFYSIPEYIYRVKLPKYHYLVGHPFLIHGGCGSLHRNTRLHFYHGLSEDSQSKTFFVPWEIKDRTEHLNLMRENATIARKKQAKLRKKNEL